MLKFKKKEKTNEVEKMSILDFCKGYRNQPTDEAKAEYIKKNLAVRSYLPILEKDVLAERIANATMFKHEGEGEDRKRTDIVHINSVVQRVLFVRMIIEGYTNLQCTTQGFFEEYDALKQSGLYDVLLVDYEDAPSLIPGREIAECSELVELKISDIFRNYDSPTSFISNQVERFGKLANLTIEPILNALQSKIGDIPREDLDNVIQMAKEVKDGDYKEVNE